FPYASLFRSTTSIHFSLPFADYSKRQPFPFPLPRSYRRSCCAILRCAVEWLHGQLRFSYGVPQDLFRVWRPCTTPATKHPSSYCLAPVQPGLEHTAGTKKRWKYWVSLCWLQTTQSHAKIKPTRNVHEIYNILL